MVTYYTLIALMVMAGVAGFCVCGLFTVPKNNALQNQLDAKIEQWCSDCTAHKRLRYALDRLEDVSAENLSLRQRAENRRTA